MSHSLGPHVVGQRVVVRRIVPGETGPTGGPAFTDVLGTCESWGDGEVVLRTEEGDEVRIATSLIVSGKPVPPRPSRFRRLGDDEVDARVAALRDGPAPPPPVDVSLIGVARLARELGDGGGEVHAIDREDGTLVVEVLLDGDRIASATLRHDDDWALLRTLDVDDAHRRRGTRRMLLAAVTSVLAERGVSVLVGEIPADDPAARGLASAIGFERHHTTTAEIR